MVIPVVKTCSISFFFYHEPKGWGFVVNAWNCQKVPLFSGYKAKTNYKAFFIIYYKNIINCWSDDGRSQPAVQLEGLLFYMCMTSSSYFIKCSSCEKKFEHRPFTIIIASLCTEMCNKYYFYFQLQWPKD